MNVIADKTILGVHIGGLCKGIKATVHKQFNGKCNLLCLGFGQIPPQVVDNVDQSAIAEDIDDISSHKNATVVDIFDDFEDDELDEIANEYSLSNGPKSKLRKKKSSDDDSEKDKKEEKLDKGQTTLFSF